MATAYKYQDEVLTIHGDVVPYAVINVYNAGTVTPATLYANTTSTIPLANPVTADYQGYFFFYAALGTYDIRISGTGITTRTLTDIWLGSAAGGTGGDPSELLVDGTTYANIQAAITAAGSNHNIRIPAGYAGSDTYTNPNKIQIYDMRGPANRERGYINMLTDCGLKGDGVTDDSTAANTCFAQYPGATFYFPQTNFLNNPSYFFAASLAPANPGTTLCGSGSTFLNDVSKLGGTVLKFPAGVTGINLAFGCGGCTIRDLSILGSEGTNQLQAPTLLNIPSAANLPLFDRAIASIQRAANVLTVTITRVVAIEGLTQQVGSTVKITGVVGDATMNGTCVVSALSGFTAYGGNPNTFTCAQNGANSGPFLTDGTLKLPTTGASTADGIRVCSNFINIRNVAIQSFGRHGINADSAAGHGCALPYSDDLILRDCFLNGNQGNGYLCYGGDCNAHLIEGNAIYYNVMWGIEDQSSLGNTHVGNQISNNSRIWWGPSTPPTKTISTISRTLSGSDSIVTVVLSQADTSMKLGSCMLIAGVTDASFNSPAGQCYFITTYTDSTHFQYIQPGAPINASSSGGTSRMGKPDEVYLSAGIDDGAQKIQTQSAVAQPVIFSNYVEGGQYCKFGGNTISIGGANVPPCAFSPDWVGAFMTTQGASGLGGHLTLSEPYLVFAKDFAGETGLRAGVTTSQNYGLTWLTYNSLRAWNLTGSPTGTLGGSGYFELRSQGVGQTRMIFFGKDNTGHTYLSAEGAGGTVYFGRALVGANAGTGGIQVWSGGAASAFQAGIDGAGIISGPTFKSTTPNPSAAGTFRLAKTDTFSFRNNANGADITALSLDGSDNLVLPTVASLTSAGAITGASLGLGGDSISVTPREVWGAFLPGVLTATWTGAQFTPKKAITVVQIEVAAKTAPVTCAPNAIIRVTDGTTNLDTTLSAATVTNNIAGGQAYAANSVLQVKVSTAAAGCGTTPADVNVTIQYKMQ